MPNVRLRWVAGLLWIAACSHQIDGPSPTATALTPSLVCGEQITTNVEIAGSGLSPLAIDALTGDPKLALPDVTLTRVKDVTGAAVSGATPVLVPNDPTNPADALLRWTSQTSMTLIVAPRLGLAPGLYDVTVTNRNGHTFQLAAAITAVGRPVLTKVEPDLLCVDQEDRDVTLTGTSFLMVGDSLPTVAYGDVTLPITSLEDCVALPGPTQASLCTTAHATIPKQALEPGAPALVVENPTPAACHSEDQVTSAIVPAPTVTKVEPDLICNTDGTATVTVTGTGFINVEGQLPTVHIGDSDFTAASVDGCATVAGTLLDANSCTTLTVQVPVGALDNGPFNVSVENPAPAGCVSQESVTLTVENPIITSIDPAAVCTTGQPTTMTVNGSGFLVIGGTKPSVAVDGASVTLVDIAGCTAVTGTQVADVSACTSIVFGVPEGGFTSGPHTVTVKNPAPVACTSATTASARFDVATAPSITSVEPVKICSTGGMFAVHGTGFVPGTQVFVDAGEGQIELTDTTFVSATEIDVSVEAGNPPAGTYTVTVSNGPGCEGTGSATLKIVDPPIVFFVDPPALYNQINTQVTVYASGLQSGAPTVSIRLTGTDDTPIALTDIVYDSSRPTRILATVTAGTAAGDYDVFVNDAPCVAELDDAMHLRSEVPVTITSIDPPFGWTGDNTPVEIISGPGGELFTPTPRVYLSPVGAGGLATELRAVSFIDTGLETTATLDAVVPAGLKTGFYDLIVVNPNGDVGFLGNAYEVKPDPSPVITDLTPGLVSNKAAQQVVISGGNFRQVPGDGVTATCKDVAGASVGDFTATISAQGPTQITTTWDFSTLAGGAICVVRVENADGTFGEFSALSITNPSSNLNTFQAATTMKVARRAAAGAAVRLNSLSRFVYAIGGDSGAGGSAIASVDFAQVGPFGNVLSWALQRTSLPAARTLSAAAVAGRFIYLVGGRVGSTATDSVLRAYLLDPLNPEETPEVTDLDLKKDPTGLDGGIWTYRVSAVMKDDDPTNPGGESLASEPFLVQLPILPAPDKVQLTLFWTPIAGAKSYNIYRTPTPNAIGATAQLLANVPAPASGTPSYVDTGDSIAESAPFPLPLGSLGNWRAMASLGTPRAGAGVTAVPDPAGSGKYFLYAIGGLDDGGAVLSSEEFAVITPSSSSAQAMGDFADTGGPMTSGRWQLGAVYIDTAKAIAAEPGQAWVYALSGVGANGTNGVASVSSFEVLDGGALDAPVQEAAPSAVWGYGYVSGNNFLHILGGDGPTSGGRKAQVCAANHDITPSCGSAGPPGLENWTAGTTLNQARFLPATAGESGFIFLMGGQTASEAATATTERTNF